MDYQALANLLFPNVTETPETLEEKLVCLADKFFSKSANSNEKTIEDIRRSMKKFAPSTLERFDELCLIFNLRDQ